jgi:hypothetical protein
MAQSTKTRKTKSSNGRGNTRQKATGSSRSTSTKRSNSTSSNRRGSNGGRAKGASASRSRSRTQSRSPQNRNGNGAGSLADTAMDKAKTSGRAVIDAAVKAKTPLIAGATALVGAAGGAVIKSRLAADSSKKSPLKRLGGSKQMVKLGKVDLDTVKTLATQMKNYGQQASDIADAVEKTRKKN